ncbi:MAG TPA: DUF6335 family protein [Vicinamibacteria bacterium]|nr:DUF6335 family protein [Vicinamibacteria bacterium]
MASRKGKANGARSRRARGTRGAFARLSRPVGRPEAHLASATAVAAEALRTGVLPTGRRRREAIPREGVTMRVGDPDDDSLANEYVGEDVPGGSTPTPDQSNVDEIGRAYGVQEEDNGTLRTSREVLGRRDRRRPELQPPGRSRS